jgi:hypothetical protein
VELNVKVFDLIGQEVIDKNISSDEQLDVSDLPSGPYVLKVFEGSKSATQRFVKK